MMLLKHGFLVINVGNQRWLLPWNLLNLEKDYVGDGILGKSLTEMLRFQNKETIPTRLWKNNTTECGILDTILQIITAKDGPKVYTVIFDLIAF